MLAGVLLVITGAIAPALGVPQGIGWNDWYCNCYEPGTRESEVGDLCEEAGGGIIVFKGIVQCRISILAGLPNPGSNVFTDKNCETLFGNGWRGQCDASSSALDPATDG